MTAAQASVASGPLSGLASCTTKFPQTPKELIVDTARSRISKLGRSIMHSASLHEAAVIEQFQRATPIFGRLSYAADVKPAAQDMRQLWGKVRKWFDRQVKGYPKSSKPRFRFCWVAELTKKGRVHYHFILFLPPDMKVPFFDKCGWWPHGSTRVEFITENTTQSTAGYCAKYISKATGGRTFPKGLRTHGVGGLTRDEASAKRYHCAPTWVREHFDKDEQPRPMQGGGWFSRVTGQIQTSPYYIISTKAGRVVVGVYKWYRDQLSQKSLTQDQINESANDTHDACLRYLSRYVL